MPSKKDPLTFAFFGRARNPGQGITAKSFQNRVRPPSVESSGLELILQKE